MNDPWPPREEPDLLRGAIAAKRRRCALTNGTPRAAGAALAAIFTVLGAIGTAPSRAQDRPGDDAPRQNPGDDGRRRLDDRRTGGGSPTADDFEWVDGRDEVGGRASSREFSDRANRPTPASEPSIEAVRRALRRYRHEPTATQVVASCLRQAEVTPEQVRSTASRARMSGWVPMIALSARRGQGQDLSALLSDPADRTHVSTADTYSVEGRLTFHLDRLIYGRDEVALLRERRALDDDRRRLIRLVVHIYYRRRRLLLERDLLGLRDLDQAMLIEEATALLDVFTGGEFRRMIAVGRSRGGSMGVRKGDGANSRAQRGTWETRSESTSATRSW